MKNILTILSFLLLSFSTFAQTEAELKSGEASVVWLGVDCSHMKFIGDANQWAGFGDINNEQLINKYFPGWNQLFINEAKKYDVAKALRRSKVEYDVKQVQKLNQQSIKQNFFSMDPNDFDHWTEKDIQKFVSKYSAGKGEIGMSIIVEAMDKEKGMTSMWITFIRLKDKKVIFTKRLEEKAGGFGFRNYWASSFHKALKTTEKNWKNW